jgi:hypothetical protein
VKAFSTSSGAPVGSVRASRGVSPFSPVKGRLRFVSGGVSSGDGIVFRCWSRTAKATDASCRALRIYARRSGRNLGGAEDRSERRTTAALSRSEAPSAGRSLRAVPCWRKQQLAGPPLVPRLGRLGPASDMLSPAASGLDPKPEPVIHRSASSRMTPDDFCNDVDAGARPPTLRPPAPGEPGMG